MARQVIDSHSPLLLPTSSLVSRGGESRSQSLGERRVENEQMPDIQKSISGLQKRLDEQRWWLREVVTKEFQGMKQFIQQELEDSRLSQEQLHKSIQLELRSLKRLPFEAKDPKDESFPSAIQTGVVANGPGDAVASPSAEIAGGVARAGGSGSARHASAQGGRDDGYTALSTQDLESWDPSCTYNKVLESIVGQRSVWHDALDQIGLMHWVRDREPLNFGTAIIRNPMFNVFQSMLILVNTSIMAFEAEKQVSAQLQDPVGEVPKWLSISNNVFNGVFAVELLFRLIAQRSWFFVDPNEWGWNLFDFILVNVCIAFDLFSDTQLSFIRTVRIFRVFRVARIIRVMRFFRQLRQMLYSIMACLASLAWAFLFLASTMGMFSLVCMQGMVEALEQERNSGTPIILEGGTSLHDFIETWYGTFAKSIFALVASVTGGEDWAELMQPMVIAGPIFATSFCAYVLFVIVGVMNVLTGVFLNSASEFVDADLIVQNEQVRVESFCEQVISLFLALDQKASGKVDWATFQTSLSRADIQAYMSSMGLEPTHIRLVFDLLDRDGSGEIEMQEFVMGLVKLKGTAKAIDARIIQREIGLLLLEIQKSVAARPFVK